jgi:hypothetical protein
MVKKTLFIEGTTDDTNGDLRKGFNILLEKKLKGMMPRIKLGNDKKSTIKKFSNCNDDIAFALIDLDGKNIPDLNAIIKIKSDDLSELGIQANSEYVFFMVQEMEAWFLSQPEILEQYYNDSKISSRIPRKSSQLIPDPSDVLQTITRATKKGKYHKVKHGVELLCKLDIDKLVCEFDDVQKLIEKLK